MTLPDEIIYKVAYNTNTRGPAPLGETGPWDSLNIGTYAITASPSIGTDPDPGFLIWNSAPLDVSTAPELVGGLPARIHVGK